MAVSPIPSGDEDEPWSPTTISFALLAARWAGVTEESLVCDLGAGEAVASLAIARRTGARVDAVDASPAAIDAMRARAATYGLGGRFVPILGDASGFLAAADHGDGRRYDVVLAEGGIAGVVGHRLLFERAWAAMAPGGMLVTSGYVYNGSVESGSGLDVVSAGVPEDVRRHHEETRHANGRREILDEQEMLRVVGASGFRLLLNCRSGQNHWSAYFNRMAALCRQGTGAAKVYGSTERQVGADEAFHNLRGQRYLSYAMVMAVREPG